MMEGITILAIDTGCNGVPLIAAIICGIVLLVELAMSIKFLVDGECLLGTICILLLCFVLFSLGSVIMEEVNTTYYQVTIDDSVSFVEFTQHYEIVSQEGLIYTVIERGS